MKELVLAYSVTLLTNSWRLAPSYRKGVFKVTVSKAVGTKSDSSFGSLSIVSLQWQMASGSDHVVRHSKTLQDKDQIVRSQSTGEQTSFLFYNRPILTTEVLGEVHKFLPRHS